MSFLTPLFLLGLTAIAAPVIVHLVRRTKAPRVEFPSLMFVRRIPQRTIRRRQLRNLLLLLLRILAFLLLALAFVRPYFSDAGGGRERRGSSLILIDRSLSMRAGGRFAAAKARALELIGQAGEGEMLGLATFDSGVEVLSKPTTERERLREALTGLEPGYGATDYAQALRGAEGLLRDAGTGERRIDLITDFQGVGMPASESGYRLSPGIEVAPHDVGARPVENVALSEFGAVPVIFQPKYTEKLTARIANFSETEARGIVVDFLLNERSVEKREVKIPAGDFATVEFSGFNLNEGVNQCALQISGDGFADDNRFVFTLRREARGKALGIETATRGRSESLYLRSAMTAGENLPFDFELKTAATVNPAEVAQYQMAVVNDATISPALAERLLGLVEGGGGLIIAAGPHTTAASFNQVFAKALPARIGAPAELRGGYVTMSEIRSDHPIFEVFRESGRLVSARVFGYQQVEPSPGASVLARYEDGWPALVELPHGRGRILLFTSTLDASWNDLPLKSFYLPFLRQMARYIGGPERPVWHPVGEVVAVVPGSDGSLPAVDSPPGRRLLDLRQAATGETMVPVTEPGFYRVRYNTLGTTAEPLAVNSAPAESNPTRLDPKAFIASLGASGGGGQSGGAGEPNAPTGTRASREEEESRQRVWLYLLIAALVFFVAEAIVARRIRMAKIIE